MLHASNHFHLWRFNAKHGASFPSAFLLIKLLFTSILASCMLFSEMPVHIFFFVILFPTWVMHGNKHINKATKSHKVMKTLKNWEAVRTGIDAHNHYLFFLFLIFICWDRSSTDTYISLLMTSFNSFVSYNSFCLLKSSWHLSSLFPTSTLCFGRGKLQ